MSLLDEIHKADLLTMLETFRHCKTGPKYKDPTPGYDSLCYNMMATCDAIYAPNGVSQMDKKNREAWNLMYNNMEDWMVKTWKTWPKFSGLPYFPVPAPDQPFGSDWHKTTFYAAANSGTMWAGPYGESRKKLAGFLFEQLAAYLMTRP